MKALLVGAMLLATTAAPAAAQVTWWSTQATATGDPGLGVGESVVVDFDSFVAGITYSGSYTIGTGLVSGFRAPPFGTTTNYFATPGVGMPTPGTATIDFSSYLLNKPKVKTVSFYWGSIDSYNTLEVLGAGGAVIFSIDGSQVNNPANGNQFIPQTNRRFTLQFNGPETFTGLRLNSGQRAFEIDDIALSVVPEPATWTMLLAGLAAVGGMGYRRRKAAA